VKSESSFDPLLHHVLNKRQVFEITGWNIKNTATYTQREEIKIIFLIIKH